MELQRLVLAAESDTVTRIAQYTRMDCALLNGATSFADGTAIIIVRANSPDSIAKGAAAIRNASSCRAPVIVIAGFDDDIGKAYLNEAKKCGIPGECILMIKDGTVVDALGNPLGKPLRNTAIGVKTALDVARRSIRENLLPEVSIWDSSEPAGEEESGAEPGAVAGKGNDAAHLDKPEPEGPAAGAKVAAGGDPAVQETVSPSPEKAAPARSPAPATAPEAVAAPDRAESPVAPVEPALPETAASAGSAPNSPAYTVFPWYGFVQQAKNIVAVFGVKEGAGASMVAACLAGRMTEQSSLYLEVGPTASGYAYYGRSPAEAARTGKYAYCDKDTLTGSLRPASFLVIDVCFPEALDMVYQLANYVVVVTDGSTLGFEKTQNWIKGGWRVDTLVVNKVLYGSGYPPEVYIREFNITNVIGIPGGNEEKVAIHIAQRKGILPFGRSTDLDDAIKSLANKILETAKK